MLSRMVPPQIWLVLLMFCAALLPRLIMAVNTPVIARDGVGYIEASRGGTDAFARERLPLYPLAIKALDHVLGDPVWAGKAVSIVAGALFAVMMFFLARCVHPSGGAWAVFFVAATQPYLIRYSGDVLTEALYLFLMATLFLFVVHANRAAYVVGGVLAAALCLTRPEGFAVAFIVFIGLFVQKGMAEKNRVFGKRKVLPGFFLVSLLLCLLAAYLTGAFQKRTADLLSHAYAQSLSKIENTELPRNPPALMDFVRDEPERFFKKTFKGFPLAVIRLMEAVHPVVFILSLVGLWAALTRRMNPGSIAVILFPSAFFFVFLAVIYPSKRLLLQCSIPMLLWAGWGINWLGQWQRSRVWVGPCILILVCVLCLLKAGISQRTNKMHIRSKGEEIAAMAKGVKPLVITSSSRIAFYAGGERLDPYEVLDREYLARLLEDRPETPVFYVREGDDPLKNLDLSLYRITIL